MAKSVAIRPAAYHRNEPGGAGINLTEVNRFSGLRAQFSGDTAVKDLSGATATDIMFVAPRAGRITQAFWIFTEAASADAGSVVSVGSLLYSSGTLVTDSTKYASVTTTVSAAVGDMQELTLASDLTFIQGEVITTTHVQKTGTGEGYVIFTYELDDVNPRNP